jgi:hypothetical protein
MHHNTAARSLQYFPVIASKVSTPDHSSSKSSTRGYKKTSKAFPGERGSGISKAIMKLDSCMHNQGGKLYGITKTGHML